MKYLGFLPSVRFENRYKPVIHFIKYPRATVYDLYEFTNWLLERGSE